MKRISGVVPITTTKRVEVKVPDNWYVMNEEEQCDYFCANIIDKTIDGVVDFDALDWDYSDFDFKEWDR